MSPFDKKYTIAEINALNAKSMEKQFFTPDRIYADLELFKDIGLGAIYHDLIVKKNDRELFETVQRHLLENIKPYQTRKFETIEPFFKEFGYDDTFVSKALEDQINHDQIFLLAPNSKFIQLLARHLYRNANHSSPAERFETFVSETGEKRVRAIAVTLTINTYPLTISESAMSHMAALIGESLGVNVVYVNKNPELFDIRDWKSWLSKIDCFYCSSIVKFFEGPFILERCSDMAFVGKYMFFRKRLRRECRDLPESDIEFEIQRSTPQLDVMCDFAWLTHNDLRLVDDPDVKPIEKTLNLNLEG